MRPIRVTMSYADGEFIAEKVAKSEEQLAYELVNLGWISSRECVAGMLHQCVSVLNKGKLDNGENKGSLHNTLGV
jgi:hypothetical protein